MQEYSLGQGCILSWAHYPQEEQEGSAALWIRQQQKAGVLVVWFLVSEAHYRDKEHHLSAGKGAWACAGGWEIMSRQSCEVEGRVGLLIASRISAYS